MTTIAQLDTGLRYARNEQYDEAVKEFTSLLSQDQTDANAFFYRGCAYLHLCEYEKAIHDFKSAISSVDLSASHVLPAFYKRGYAYLKTNQLESALDDYKYYLKLCKNLKQNHLSHKGHFQMGIIYAVWNEHDLAVSHFTKAIDKSNDTEEDKQKLYYLHRGRAYACCAKYDQAQTDLKLVVEKSTDPFIKGCAYNELGQHNDALREFDNLLQTSGDQSKLAQTFNDHIRFRRGLSCAGLNLHDQALDEFQYALNYSKQQGSSNIIDRILFRRGLSHMALNNPHQALIDLNESTKLNESQLDVFYARSMVHYTLGRHDAAVYDQRKAMELERQYQSSTPVQKTIYHTVNYGDNLNNHVYYEEKIREAEDLLKKIDDPSTQADIHRMIAEYLQKQASSSNDPLRICKIARDRMKIALNLSSNSKDADSVSLAVNNFFKAHCLLDKVANRIIPVSVIKEYIDCAADSILDMSNLFDKCVNALDWHNLTKILRNELSKSKTQRPSKIDKIRSEYINNQLGKSKMIQSTMDKFADSPAQQEFYKFLVIRLCNLFDGIRMATTGIFSNVLEGTFSKVSWAFKLLGKVSDCLPIGGAAAQKVFALCETGAKKIDEIRIENTLNHIGILGTQAMLNKTADDIATELTIMYENQINRFPLQSDMATNDTTDTNDQQEPTACSKCANSCKRCFRCLIRFKENLLNEAEHSIIQTIVEYGISQLLNCVTNLKIKQINKTEDLQNVFVNDICRPPSKIAFRIKRPTDTIKPKGAENDDKDWHIDDFFRRPAIEFKDGTKRAQEARDEATFGCRKATFEEEYLLKNKPEELDKRGFKILINTDN